MLGLAICSVELSWQICPSQYKAWISIQQNWTPPTIDMTTVTGPRQFKLRWRRTCHGQAKNHLKQHVRSAKLDFVGSKRRNSANSFTFTKPGFLESNKDGSKDVTRSLSSGRKFSEKSLFVSDPKLKRPSWFQPDEPWQSAKSWWWAKGGIHQNPNPCRKDILLSTKLQAPWGSDSHKRYKKLSKSWRWPRWQHEQQTTVTNYSKRNLPCRRCTYSTTDCSQPLLCFASSSPNDSQELQSKASFFLFPASWWKLRGACGSKVICQHRF